MISAGFQLGNVAGEQSVAVKLSRIILLAPRLIMMSALGANRASDVAGRMTFARIVPTFVVAVAACMVFNALRIVPAQFRAH